MSSNASDLHGSTTDTLLAETFEQHCERINVRADDPNIDRWHSLWRRERDVAEQAPRIIPPCPSWCALPEGHDYTGVDGRDDGLTFDRTHEMTIGDYVYVTAQERNHFGRVEVDLPALDVSASGPCTPYKARKLAQELAFLAYLLDWLDENTAT